jgi:hypothetical protein
MNPIKHNILLIFILHVGICHTQDSVTKQLHFYYGKDKKSENTLDMEFHGDTLVYYHPAHYEYKFIIDSTYENYLRVVDSVLIERRFIGRGATWKISKNKDTIFYQMIWRSGLGNRYSHITPYKLYLDKSKESIGCMFPSQLSILVNYYMYDPEKSYIVTKYEGKKWLFLFGQLKRSYKFRYYYYNYRDTTKLLWYHDLYLDKKNNLPLIMDEAAIYTVDHEIGKRIYLMTENRRIQYRKDKKKKIPSVSN